MRLQSSGWLPPTQVFFLLFLFLVSLPLVRPLLPSQGNSNDFDDLRRRGWVDDGGAGGPVVAKRSGVAVPPTIRGVNIGGWLITEPWITPNLYNSGGIDEWSLCNILGKTACLRALQRHWSTFFTREDFVNIKAAGLTHVRIPVGYWAVDLLDYEPYVSGQYPWLIQAINWCQELGLNALIDLHGAPGSQNGQDNSGLTGPTLFSTNGTNAERSIAVLKNLTTEFSQTIYGGVVIGIELLNEPRPFTEDFTMAQLKTFYSSATAVVRDAASTGMKVVLHDAFYGIDGYWANYDPTNRKAKGSPDWLLVDFHSYFAFSPNKDLPHDEIIQRVCNVSRALKTNATNLPNMIVGEWSLETGLEPGTLSSSNRLTQDKRTWLRTLFEAQLAAYSPNAEGQPLQGFYFWTWKTEYDIDTWSYQYGLQMGYIPRDLSNSSLLAFPVLDDGCIDAGFAYTAPARSSSVMPSLHSRVTLLIVLLSSSICIWLALA